MKITKKETFEAAKFTGLKNEDYPNWLKQAIEKHTVFKSVHNNKYRISKDNYFSINKTYIDFLEGDWVIKSNDDGELYAITDLSFKEFYKEVK